MSAYDSIVHFFYHTLVHTLLLPIRNQAFESTRNTKISDTEKEALEAGSVGFEREFLSGQPDWRKLMDMPPPQLTDEEQAFLDGPVETLCDMLDDWKIRSEIKDLPPAVWTYLKKHRFFGMIIPKEYDGLGFSALAHSQVILKLASRSTTACVTTMVPNSLGPAELLTRYGTDEQKNYYLPRLARGEEIPAFALTEPNAGSDASGMTAKGVVCERDGELGILLNWDKRYITLSSVCTLLGLAFKLYDPDKLLGDKTSLGITLALIPTNTPGVTANRRHNPMGVPFHNGPTSGKDVWIPLSYIIGGRDYAGKGWRMLMECLSVGRCVSLPALSVGSAKLVCRIAGAYSRVRRQFKVSIGKFEGIEELLARIAGTTYMMDAARTATLQMLDRGEHPAILSAILKYHMTEHARKVVMDGMDILGGKAISEGPGNFLGSLYQGMPIGITVEGANILTRNMIIFGQASVRSHPYIREEVQAAKLEDKDEARREFSRLMARHVRMSTNNAMRTLMFGLLDGATSRTPKCPSSVKPYFQHINRLSASYAFVADMVLMLLGSSVKRKERISALLGDVMSYLYMASCTLRHFMAKGQPEEDLPALHWACQQMLYHAEESMDRLFQNFPSPLLGKVLRVMVFPRGRRFKPSSHRLDHKVAKIILASGESRDRLTQGIYLPTQNTEPLAQLEQAFYYALLAEPLEAKIFKARKNGQLTANRPEDLLQEAMGKGVLTTEEGEHLKQADTLRRQVIQVDDFDMNFGLEPDHSSNLALADGKSLREVYPMGTRWDIDIPRTTLVGMVEEAVSRFAKHPCIDFLGRKYTYDEVGKLIEKAAAGFQTLGVAPGDKIGFYMPNTSYYPIMFFAALKAGATVVNFCPMHTESEIRVQAKDSEVRWMITLDIQDLYTKCLGLQKEGIVEQVILCRMEDALPFFKAQAYRFIKTDMIARPDEADLEPKGAGKKAPVILAKDLFNTPERFHNVEIAPDDVALLQYTGGTTGTPKGAMLTHYNLVSNVFQMEEYYQTSSDKPDVKALLRPGMERVLVSIPYFHIFGTTVAMLYALKIGSELVILPDPRNTKEALKTFQEKRATLFLGVPRLLQAMIENPKASSFDLSMLETVISGGAALPPNILQGFESLVRKKGVIKQGYGLTETAPVATSNPPFGINRPESVGLPLPQTRIKIVDAENPYRTLRMGEIGEICISGPQVMKGYYNRPEETQDILHGEWLHTGDLGYLDDDYYLHIVDRKKRLILVNGINVYPTQIEAAISKHPDVAECLVISVPDPRSGEAAKAFIRLKAGLINKPTAKQMTDFLATDLSRMEIPKHIEFAEEELPKTVVGKPDWRALQEKERVKYEETEKVTPLYDDPLEQAL